ncbi:MAG: enoyl-CoA hydratase/isomerase family protein [Acidimicrobiia bacterium]
MTDDAVAVVTIANPGARNALDDRARRQLLSDLRDVTARPEVRAVVLVGEADAFCAGGDLPSMPTEPGPIAARLGEMHDIVALVHAGPKPVVAAVEGPAYGSGMALAAACDHVVASQDASFGCTFGRVGLMADTGLIWTLPRRVGPAAARRILLGSAVLSAGEAAEVGLADELVPAGGALDRAVEVAGTWRRAAPGALAATRRMLADGLAEVLRAELAEQTALLATADFAEGRAAFADRRRPRFGGSAD